MKLINFDPLVGLSFYNDIDDTGGVIGLVTKYNRGKPVDQHLLNSDDIPELIGYLNDCIKYSGNKRRKKRTKRSLVHKTERLSRNILQYKNDAYGISCSWIVPGGKYNTSNGKDMKYVTWPDMLFIASGNSSLNIFFYDTRLNINQEAFLEFNNISNVFSSGSVCLGSSKKIPLREIGNLSINDFTDYFESQFFETLFSPKLKVKNGKIVFKTTGKYLSFNEIIDKT